MLTGDHYPPALPDGDVELLIDLLDVLQVVWTTPDRRASCPSRRRARRGR